MQAVTGRDIVLRMLELTTDMARWNKRYTTKEVLLQKLNELGLTSHQVEVLAFMHANPEFDTVSALASELFISKGSLSLMLSKLQLGGFLQKTSAKGEDDGRKVYITLTEKGKHAVDEIRETIVNSAAALFDGMDEASRTLFYLKTNELQELFSNIGGWNE